MFQLIFSDQETDRVKSIVTDVQNVRHINSREVAITELGGQRRSIAFHENEKLEVRHNDVKRIEP